MYTREAVPDTLSAERQMEELHVILLHKHPPIILKV